MTADDFSLLAAPTALAAPDVLLCALACALPLLLVLLAGQHIIPWLRTYCAEPIRTASPQLNALLGHKQHTPTLGGLLFLGAFCLVLVALLPTGRAVPAVVLFTAIAFALLGLYDDLIKLRTARRGMRARYKLAVQCLLAAVVALWIEHHFRSTAASNIRQVPLLGEVSLGAWWTPTWALLIVAYTNAVNLTDGLDGLAAGCSAWLLAACAAAALIAVPLATPTLLATLALLGALLGFLRFNRCPAQVFMGNTGSTALGALIAVLAILLHLEWLLLLAGGVFVAEAVSVMAQVGYYKWRRQRLLRCAPLHHHYQFAGWPERTIVRRFCLAAGCLATLAVAVAMFSSTPPERPALAAKSDEKFLSQDDLFAGEVP